MLRPCRTHRERPELSEYKLDDHIVHKSDHSFWAKSSCPQLYFVVWNSLLLPYGGTVLGRRNCGRTPRLGMVSQTRPPKAWRNLSSFVHNSPSAFSSFALYNTQPRQVFPGRKHFMRHLAGPCFRCARIFFSRSTNNVTVDV